MKSRWKWAALILAGTLCGCQTHMMFIEESHIGLKAEMSADGTTPAQLDVGMRRGVAAFIPQNVAYKPTSEGSIKQTPKETTEDRIITLKPADGELTNLYNHYEANVGFFDPIEVKHFLATGVAAANVVADPECLDYLWKGGKSDEQK